jgi:phosphoglycerate dehydrogenase-like enzyme
MATRKRRKEWEKGNREREKSLKSQSVGLIGKGRQKV